MKRIVRTLPSSPVITPYGSVVWRAQGTLKTPAKPNAVPPQPAVYNDDGVPYLDYITHDEAEETDAVYVAFDRGSWFEETVKAPGFVLRHQFLSWTPGVDKPTTKPQAQNPQ